MQMRGAESKKVFTAGMPGARITVGLTALSMAGYFREVTARRWFFSENSVGSRPNQM